MGDLINSIFRVTSRDHELKEPCDIMDGKSTLSRNWWQYGSEDSMFLICQVILQDNVSQEQ